ncbi:MAG TPA: hypothetical protein ENK85_04985 [Saprospiraceae bacterium]|nr:hypothetical protein [Saprospiraceae bacterium]
MTNYRHRIFFVLFFALWSVSFLFGQKIDTLKRVQSLNQTHQYKESLKLLNDYRHHHKNDIYGDWLHAHTISLTGQFALAQNEYYALENKHPYNYDIKLDRINKVIEHGYLNKAIKQLQKIEPQLPKDYNFIAHKRLAQLFYWKGDYDKAYKEISKAIYIYNNEPSALKLKEQIVRARSNWANINLGVFNDDQPLNIIAPDVEAGLYVNTLMTVGAGISYPIYSFSDNTYTTPWLTAFTNFNLIESKIGVKVGLGVIGYKSKEKALTGLLHIKKQFSKYMSLSASAELAPYLATSFTIPDKLMQTSYGINFDYNNPKGFIGKASYNINQFSTLSNSYYTASGWVVSPPLTLGNLELRAGYGINYSDSKKNNFTAVESLDTIIANWDSTYSIEGHFNPFFSPNNQLIHSAVGMIKYTFNKDLNIGMDINYGFSARTDAPYLFLDKNTNGETQIGRKYHKTKYNPLDINTFINYKWSDDLNLKAFYKFQRTVFYESNYIGLSSHLTF